MLLEMKRDAASCGEEVDVMESSGKHNSSTLLSSQLRYGEDPASDSSDDMSTFKSPVCVLGIHIELEIKLCVFTQSHCSERHSFQ